MYCLCGRTQKEVLVPGFSQCSPRPCGELSSGEKTAGYLLLLLSSVTVFQINKSSFKKKKRKTRGLFQWLSSSIWDQETAQLKSKQMLSESRALVGPISPTALRHSSTSVQKLSSRGTHMHLLCWLSWQRGGVKDWTRIGRRKGAFYS